MKPFIALTVLLLISSALFADIESMRARIPQIVELKDKGVIGERLDGYLGVVKSDADHAGAGGRTSTPDAQALVDSENSDRRAEYTKRASAQGQTVDVLATVLGEARIRQEKAGRMVQDASGNWVKK